MSRGWCAILSSVAAQRSRDGGVFGDNFAHCGGWCRGAALDPDPGPGWLRPGTLHVEGNTSLLGGNLGAALNGRLFCYMIRALAWENCSGFVDGEGYLDRLIISPFLSL